MLVAFDLPRPTFRPIDVKRDHHVFGERTATLVSTKRGKGIEKLAWCCHGNPKKAYSVIKMPPWKPRVKFVPKRNRQLPVISSWIGSFMFRLKRQ